MVMLQSPPSEVVPADSEPSSLLSVPSPDATVSRGFFTLRLLDDSGAGGSLGRPDEPLDACDREVDPDDDVCVASGLGSGRGSVRVSARASARASGRCAGGETLTNS